MSKAHLAALVLILMFVRWLATGHVTVMVAGFPVMVPVLAVAAVAETAVAGAVVALIVYQGRAERAMRTAWQAQKAAAR